MTSRRIHLANQRGVETLVRAVVQELNAEGKLKYFANAENAEHLVPLLARSIRDLRFAEVASEQLQEMHFESADKFHDFECIYRYFLVQMEARNVWDWAAAISYACEALASGLVELPKDLVVLLPGPDVQERICETALERKLLDALIGQAAKTSKPPEVRLPESLGDLAEPVSTEVLGLQFQSAIGA